MKQFFVMITLLILLLIFHNAVITGTQNGLLLWYQTLIPSLLPFILVTNALSETNAYQTVVSHFRNYNQNRIYEIMSILVGNLCGYPIGAKIINDFVKNNCLSTNRANQILSLASQASPMFLIGFVYTHIIENKLPLSIFLISIYLPVGVYYIFFCIITNQQTHTSSCMPIKKLYIKDTFLHAVETMVMIGIYVIIFSILLSVLLPICDKPIFKIILSFMEITTGLKLLTSLELSEHIQISLLCALSASGGLCSAYQVKGVLEYPKTQIKKYLLDKCILSTGTFCIIYLYCSFH